jgi:hypothetical protein
MRLVLLLNLIFTLIPTIIGLYLVRRLRFELKLLAILVVCASLIEFYAYSEGFFRNNSNWAYHIYGPVEYLLLIAIFYRWQKKGKIRKIIWLLGFGGFAFYIINSLFIGDRILFWLNGQLIFDPYASFDFLPIKAADVVYAAISAYTIINLIISDRGDIARIPAFWVSGALLLFSSASIVYFVSIALLSIQYLATIWKIHILTNAIANQLYAVGFITGARKKTPRDWETDEASEII